MLANCIVAKEQNKFKLCTTNNTLLDLNMKTYHKNTKESADWNYINTLIHTEMIQQKFPNYSVINYRAEIFLTNVRLVYLYTYIYI